MNSNNTNKSSRELQSDVRAEINQIKQSLENIKNRASPGQLIDDAIFYPHNGNPSLTFDHLKRNPVGTTFLAMGTLLLMEDSQHVSYEQNVKLRVGDVAASSKARVNGMVTDVTDKVNDVRQSLHNAADTARSKVSSVKGKVSSKVDSLKTKVRSTSDDSMTTDQASFDDAGMNDRLYVDEFGTGTRASGVSSFDTTSGSTSSYTSSDDTFGNRFDDVSGQAREITGNVREKLSSSMDDVSQTASQIKTSIGASTHNLSSRVRNMDPIAYIALGAGLGALSGAALPVSDAEQRLVDSKLGDSLATFKSELSAAFGQSFDVMKTEFITGITDFDFGKLKDTFSNSSSKSV